ncbi:MAG: DUF664 domain-containing protein [Bifidobacteriaceae bacterium]|jgi:SAM-dependent methyltransferase/uncharacterized damage-inducible protein DinB|nr:DUF664 domain-containing protein [Bifidobacteriaceae bacterium]
MTADPPTPPRDQTTPGLEQALADNLASWDERAQLHVESYDAFALADSPNLIGPVVRAGAELMAPHLPGGSLAGLKLAHLQCHIGTDSLGLARLGATVTGVDFSGEAVKIAKSLAERSGLADRLRFVQTSIAAAPAALGEQQYDAVYTSVGVLRWLPDLAAWATTISRLLKPGGLFFIHEDHPMLDALEWDGEQGRLFAAWPYFNSPEPVTWDDGADYSSPQVLSHKRSHEWAHPLCEIFGALTDQGLRIESFREHQTMFWQPHQAIVPNAASTGFELADHPERVPLMFSLAARKPDAVTSSAAGGAASSKQETDPSEDLDDALKQVLWRQLRDQRESLLWKLEGLGEQAARWPMTGTGTNLLGIVKHVASVESEYLGSCFGRPGPDQLLWLEEASQLDNNADMWATPEQSIEWVIAFYRRVWAHSDQTIAQLSLHSEGFVPWWGEDGHAVTLGRIMTHLIAETARHLGQADILREQTDGQTGYRPPPGHSNLPERDQRWWEDYRAHLEAVARSFASDTSVPPAAPDSLNEEPEGVA